MALFDAPAAASPSLADTAELSDPSAEAPNPDRVERALGQAEQLFSATKEVIEAVASEHPHLKEVLDRVENLLTS